MKIDPISCAGSEAYVNGILLQDCPYEYETYNWKKWVDGWYQAKYLVEYEEDHNKEYLSRLLPPENLNTK